MEALVAQGASGASSISDAVQASPSTIICIDDYSTTRRLLGTKEVAARLYGRTLIQLSTGTPREARESEIWAQGFGAQYVDGALLCGPVSIGTDRGRILCAGRKAAYASCESILSALGGDVRYLGENIAAPAVLDLAWLSERFGVFIGAAHGACLCEAENVGVDLYASMFAEDDTARWFADIIGAKAYKNPGATLQVWTAALQRIQDQANDTDINHEFPDFVSSILKRAIVAGHGEEHIAALSKIMKRTYGQQKI